MDTYFGPEWGGTPFRLFDTTHVGLLIVVAALTVAIVVAGARIPTAARVTIGKVVAVILLVNTAFWHVWNVAVGFWDAQSMLPLHLCSAMTFVTAFALWTRRPLLAALAWMLGTTGALQALLTPEVAPFGFPHYRVMQSWIQHSLLFLGGVWLVFAEGIRPTWRDLVRSWLLLHVYAAFTFVANLLIGSNYLFLNRKPEFATVLDALPPWPIYLLVLEVLASALMGIQWLLGRRWGVRRDSTTAS